jgi:hypothetical protein
MAATRTLAYLWAAPCSALGLAAALVVWPLGARFAWHRGVLEVACRAAPARHGRSGHVSLPFGAITLGHVVLASDPQQMQLLREHERAHVAQYEHWGALFLLAYPLSSVLQWLRGRRPYFDNHFEVQARAVEVRAAQSRARADAQA